MVKQIAVQSSIPILKRMQENKTETYYGSSYYRIHVGVQQHFDSFQEPVHQVMDNIRLRGDKSVQSDML
jgi:hypothetical protein